ncbi:MAG: cytochrome b [Alphaproteobacteria bacterium]|nr:MAG: cytochrome b [Alphaproteobacteria bacterium]
MALKNTENSYGWVSRLLHWLVFALVAGLLAVGLYMTDQKFSPTILKLYGLHKGIGITVLALAVLRVVWTLSNTAPKMLGLEKPVEKLAARSVHGLLYLCLFIMPLSGWVMSSAAGYPVSVFGLFTLPNLVEPSKALHALVEEIHELTAYGFMALIAAHAGAAFLHHFKQKDRTLIRMIKGE